MCLLFPFLHAILQFIQSYRHDILCTRSRISGNV